MNILVSNLGAEVTEESLNATFSAFGDVQTVSILIDQFTGKSRGSAFVEMPVEQDATLAIQKLNGAVVNGLHLEVKEGPLRRALEGSYPVGKR